MGQCSRARALFLVVVAAIAAQASLLAQEKTGRGRRVARHEFAEIVVKGPDGVVILHHVAQVIELPEAARERPGDQDEEDDEGGASPALDSTISESVFAHWVFGMEDARDARRRLREVLGIRVDEAEATYRITPAQRRKLELAGKGDIQRFFDHVAAKRAELDRLGADEHKTRRFVLTELIPLRGKIRQGPFGEGSLFAKTLNKMLHDRLPERQATR